MKKPQNNGQSESAILAKASIEKYEYTQEGFNCIIDRCKIYLNQRAINKRFEKTGIMELDFFVDGEKICRWLLQSDGGYRGNKQAWSGKNYEGKTLSPKELVIKDRDNVILVSVNIPSAPMAAVGTGKGEYYEK
jgi:hypothetical protein